MPLTPEEENEKYLDMLSWFESDVDMSEEQYATDRKIFSDGWEACNSRRIKYLHEVRLITVGYYEVAHYTRDEYISHFMPKRTKYRSRHQLKLGEEWDRMRPVLYELRRPNPSDNGTPASGGPSSSPC